MSGWPRPASLWKERNRMAAAQSERVFRKRLKKSRSNSMRRAIALGLAATMVLATPAASFAAQRAATQACEDGAISGVVRDATGVSVGNANVRIRSASGGNTVSVTQTNSRGAVYVRGIRPGDYVVEVLSPDGLVVGVSQMIQITCGAIANAGVTTTPGGPTPGVNRFGIFGLGSAASIGLISAA